VKNIGLLFVSFVALGFFACAPTPVKSDAHGRQIVEIRAWQWNYSPQTVRVRARVPVLVRAESLDVEHTVSSESLGLDLRVPAKGQGIGEIVFTPEKPGEYTLRCHADCGPARSRMTMMMIVLNK
jgi:heme/copper-type cytochrome/quinol oxidase subunit 2